MHLEQPLTRKETILDIEILYSDIKVATLQELEYARLLNPTQCKGTAYSSLDNLVWVSII